MRKSYLFAAILAMGALSSCSNDTENIAPESAQNDGRQPIILGLGNPNAVTVTRGTGTVGDIGEASKWNGEELNLLMLNKGELEYAVDKANNNQVLFANEALDAPVGADGTMLLKNGAPVRFYPATGYFDFFAYHLDDAGVATDLDTTGEDKWTVPFTINGSQDLMVGKAELTEEQTALLESEGLKPNEFYCAKSSRHGIIPTMSFKHLLTRLTFTVKPGDEKASGEGVDETEKEKRAVRVAEISIKSKTTGKMVVAYTGTVAEENLIEWDGSEMTDVVLQERVGTSLSALQAMNPVSLYGVDKATGVRAGEALLVSPEEQYTMHIVLHQMPLGTEEDMVNTFDVHIDTAGGFLAGSSYNVNITLYGIQRIDVNAVLTPWKDGGSIDKTPEDEDLSLQN